jgi:hypothetical protein
VRSVPRSAAPERRRTQRASVTSGFAQASALGASESSYKIRKPKTLRLCELEAQRVHIQSNGETISGSLKA